MAASARTPGGRARAGLILLPIVLCAGLVVGVLPPPAKAEAGAIYANAPQGYATADLGALLQQALGGKGDFTVKELDDSAEAMRRIAADPQNVGLVQRDFYVQYLRDHADSGTRFEFYGNIPVCLMAVVRRGAQVQTYGDLVRVRTARPTTLDVGPADGQLAATFATFRRMDRSLANLQLEHRGGARALGRVVGGETDAALFLVRAPYTDSLAVSMVDSGALDAVPFFSEDIVIGAVQHNLPYLLRQIDLGKPGWFSGGRPYHTTCTSLGAVVNSAAAASLSERVAQTVLGDSPAASERSWYAAVGDVFVVAFSEVQRLVTGAGDVIVAWFSPAMPGAALAEAPANSPQFQPVRDGAKARQEPASPPRGAAAAGQ